MLSIPFGPLVDYFILFVNWILSNWCWARARAHTHTHSHYNTQYSSSQTDRKTSCGVTGVCVCVCVCVCVLWCVSWVRVWKQHSTGNPMRITQTLCTDHRLVPKIYILYHKCTTHSFAIITTPLKLTKAWFALLCDLNYCKVVNCKYHAWKLYKAV